MLFIPPPPRILAAELDEGISSRKGSGIYKYVLNENRERYELLGIRQ
jgi:hypothetical protein